MDMLSRARLPRSFTTAAREVAAFARQAWLLPRDVMDPVLPEACGADEDVVVLLHGLFASAGVLRPMRAAIGRHAGLHTATMSYPPGPGVDELAARLGRLVDRIPRRARIHLVGHSLGGIVARYYAHTSRDGRVVQTISLASPFAGVRHAARLGLDGTRDLDPASPLLRALRLGAADLPHVPHLSIVAGSDALVKSPVAHALPGSDVVVLDGRGHNTLLFDDEAVALVTKRVLSRRAAAEAACAVAP